MTALPAGNGNEPAKHDLAAPMLCHVKEDECAISR
jgi:hypothetical protein